MRRAVGLSRDIPDSGLRPATGRDKIRVETSASVREAKEKIRVILIPRLEGLSERRRGFLRTTWHLWAHLYDFTTEKKTLRNRTSVKQNRDAWPEKRRPLESGSGVFKTLRSTPQMTSLGTRGSDEQFVKGIRH